MRFVQFSNLLHRDKFELFGKIWFKKDHNLATNEKGEIIKVVPERRVRLV